MSAPVNSNDAQTVREQGRAGYAGVARNGGLACEPTGSCCGGAGSASAAALPAGTRPADFVTSLNVTARKPE